MAPPVIEDSLAPAGPGSAGMSIVIPTLNGATRLPLTLESIAGQQVSAALQVIVVDDGSEDGTRGIAESVLRAVGFGIDSPGAGTAPGARGRAIVLGHPAPLGRASACNTGIGAATSPVVVILDDDMTLRPGCLEAHRVHHGAHPGGAALGRILLAAPPRDSCFSRFLAREQANRERTLLATAGDVPFGHCLTGHFSAARELLDEVGGFEAAIRLYGFEDIELAYRLSIRGVRFAYLHGAEAEHRAYMTDLDRMLDRHLEAGIVARQLAEKYPSGELREYLRVDGPPQGGTPDARPGLRALRLANRLLLRPSIRHAAGSSGGTALLRAAIAAGERMGIDRLAHFGYHVARDLSYFQGYFGERAPRR